MQVSIGVEIVDVIHQAGASISQASASGLYWLKSPNLPVLARVELAFSVIPRLLSFPFVWLRKFRIEFI